jgi:hypothetical protein
VELSRPVFKALHQIQALQHLHLRMQAGPSIYQAPPAIPASSTTSVGQSMPHSLPPAPPPMGPPGFGPPPHNPPGMSSVTYPSSSSSHNSFVMGNKYATKLHRKTTKALLPPIRKPPPTLSGFKELKTLEILDMDTLDYIGELRTCIRNSSSTLSTLKLSFSESLANKSRKPPPEVHSDDDSATEDEFGQLIPPGPPPPGMPSSSSGGPSKVLEAQEEKKKQDDVLQRIFGIQTAKKVKPSQTPKPEPEPPKAKSEEDPKLRFIRNLAPVAAKLMAHVKPGSDLSAEGTKVLDMIEKAAQMYMDTMEKTKPSHTKSDESSSKATPTASTASVDGADTIADEDTLMTGGALEGPGLFDEAPKPKKPDSDPDVANPDDIDIEEPEGDSVIELDPVSQDNDPSEESLPESNDPTEVGDSKTLVEESPVLSSIPTKADWASRQSILMQSNTLSTTHAEVTQQSSNLKKKVNDLKARMKGKQPSAADYLELATAEAEFKKMSDRIDDLGLSMEELNEQIDDWAIKAQSSTKSSGDGAKMSEYVRNTRGLALKTLSIYLIPIKANIISRAIDVNVLQSITLLNVGPQIPFWNNLAKENTLSPLPLSKIYTDNVTLPFLGLVAQLDNVTELLMLEKQKGRVESTAAKTNVTMEQIRKVLKKHVHNLRVLMIKNDSSLEWDLNIKTAMLLCTRAKRLEELSASFGIKTLVCTLTHHDYLTLTSISIHFFNSCLD